MPGRAHLSEEAEQEEHSDREKSRVLRGRLRELIDKRRTLLGDVRRLSDEQRELYDRRRPGQEEVERIHREYRQLGPKLAEARQKRDEARAKVQSALSDLRDYRSRLPKGERARPEEIRRQIAQLELRQQTTALKIAEENALIAQLRRLTQELAEAEQEKGAEDGRQRRLSELETALAERRAELAHLTDELPKLAKERDNKMQSIKGRLADAGVLFGEMRAKATARGAVMEKVRALSGLIDAAEKELDQLERASRDRRQEARAVIAEYRRASGGPVDGETARQRAADEKLEQLLKRGRVELRG